LQEENGVFYGGASDTAMMYCMIEMTSQRMKFVNELVYEYRYDTGQLGMSVNRLPQQRALRKISSTTPYNRLSDFSFIDDSINNALIL
jgi:hypothetical protein